MPRAARYNAGLDDLRILHSLIGERTNTIADAHGSWPCRRGCDHCCRHLAAIPELTSAEWHFLRQELQQLPAAIRDEIEGRIRSLSDVRPITCPLLDSKTGACLVYPSRPVACRTYGFYIERDAGLYCGIIGELQESGALKNVVWGNHASVQARLGNLGPTRNLQQWLLSEHQ